MISPSNRVYNNWVIDKSDETSIRLPIYKGTTSESSIDYYDVRKKEDPFPDTSSFDPLDIDQKNDIYEVISKLV